MALQTTTTIKIGEIVITNFSNLEIIQKIHDHHTFSLEVRKDILVEELKSVMPVAQQLYGEKISIEIKAIEGIEDLIDISDPRDHIMQFYGIIANVQIGKSRIKNIEETILISGYSSSWCLEDGEQFNSFTQMTLRDIIAKVKTNYDVDIEVRPFYKDSLSYCVQYNESHFSFLNRLAKRHAQWFYDNGRVLIFGSPGGIGSQPKLIYGVNMQDFSYNIKIVPAQFKILENDQREGSVVTGKTLDYRKEVDGFHQNFINKSNKVFNKETTIQLNQNAVGGYASSTAEEYTKNKMRSIMSPMMEIKASSEVPGIMVGNTVKISGVDMLHEGTYRVTEITHTCDDGGGYENHFSAINFSGSLFSPETNPDLVPECKSQTATVTGNADPNGLSGVQIQMPWQQAKGQTTPYVPLLQKYGGDARGSHVIPEIGDTVFVDFQGGNAELPIVVGTMTNHKEKSGFSTKDNSIKGWKFRFGQLLKFIEKVGIWLSDPSGNEIHLDEENKNMTLTTPGTLTLNCENLLINVKENMTTNVTVSKSDIIGVNSSESVGGIKQLGVTGDYNAQINGKYSEHIIGDFASKTENDRHDNSKEGLSYYTESDLNKNSQQEIKYNSGEGTRQN